MRTKLMIALAVFAALLTLAACGEDTTPNDSSASSAAPTPATSSAVQHNEADVTFLQMMIPHHAQAIEMSDLVIGKEDVPAEVVALAERVKAAQAPEIDTMTGWLEAWGEDVPEMDMDMGMDHPMSGMLTEEELQAIEDASGTEAARLYLEGMKAHHEGAIEMAETAVADGSDPAVIELAEEIITAQQAEITEIEGLLADL